ncbi:DUF397 domain-containing protein [Streptomyces sp. AV19]|nr:DUF397 domain-containing protein [Streptomyces sp. AV19]MDG4532538.1 DUF397 domain-containing protein [Streptomyces sp. AV19]
MEVAREFPGSIPVRDSKRPHGPTLSIPAEAFAHFTMTLRRGTLND